jgi:hypothetical protein
MLGILINRAKEEDQFVGIIPHLVDGGILILQYADDHKRKYRLEKWSILCQPKDQRGLGIAHLNLKNIALLSK